MTKGIVLIAVGKRGYGFMAYNIAYSIKRFNPDLHITLWHDDAAVSQLFDDMKLVFDEMNFLDENIYYTAGRFDPCKLKTNLYDLLPYDNNLYLDVDGIAMKDIEPLLDSCINRGGYYYTYIIREAKPEDALNFIWASKEDLYSHFKLEPETELNASQTSIQFIKKCDEAKVFYDKLKSNYANPLPLGKLRFTWGGGQPDELYINVTIAQSGIDAEISPDAMFFGGRIDERSPTTLQDAYYLLSIYGGRNGKGGTQTKPMYYEMYDNLLLRWHREDRREFITKSVYFKPDKWANTQQEIKQVHKVTNLQSALLPIAQSVKMESRYLLQEYTGPHGEKVIPSNWFNNSIAEFEGKVYMAYRMENRPWCTRTKIGICELDVNFQPIKSTNKLLYLHSDLKVATMQGGKSFPKGFHVEDPRLFVFNNKLFISYTDGYQMGQAEINPETLEAEDSFYIEKPLRDVTEKNWVFFEHDSKLYSVYNTSPHIIYEIDRNIFTERYREKFKHQWAWGAIRGGTSPLRIGNYFISFFHSALDSVLYKGFNSRQYFMGAYLFNAEPPFAPVAISKEPLITGEIISDAIPRLSSKIFVVFPSGAVRKKDSYIVSFGYNDLECRFIEITDKLLEENLVFTNIKELQTA